MAERGLTEAERRYLDAHYRLTHASGPGEAREARREMRSLLVLVRLEAGVVDPDSQSRSYRDSIRERPA